MNKYMLEKSHAECGMTVNQGEYHPYAACLMFKACGNSNVVEASMDAIMKEGRTLMQEKCTEACESVMIGHAQFDAGCEGCAEVVREIE